MSSGSEELLFCGFWLHQTQISYGARNSFIVVFKVIQLNIWTGLSYLHESNLYNTLPNSCLEGFISFLHPASLRWPSTQPKSIGHFSIYAEMTTLCFICMLSFADWHPCVHCIFSLRLCKRRSLGIQLRICTCVFLCCAFTYISAVAQSFVSVARGWH